MYFLMCLKVNLCQKFLFLHQLTHNMTTDCSLNYKFNTWKFLAQNTFCTEIVFDIENNFCTHHVLPIPMFCKKKSFWQRFTCVPSKRAEARFLLNSWSKKIPSKFIQGHPNTALKYYSPTFAEEKNFCPSLADRLYTVIHKMQKTK